MRVMDGKHSFKLIVEDIVCDCLDGRGELTKLWGEFFRKFLGIAEAIGYYENDNSYLDYPIMESIEAMADLRIAFKAIEDHIDPYACVAEIAARKAIEKHIQEQEKQAAS